MNTSEQATGLLLAAALHRLGGTLELSNEEQEELHEAYGNPSPLLIGRDEQGMFAGLYTLDTLEEEGWRHYQRMAAGACTEAEARQALREQVAHMRALKVLVESAIAARRQVRADQSN